MFEMNLSSSCKAHRSLIDIFIVIININNDALKMAWEDRKRVCKAGKCALTEEVGGNLTSKSVDRGEKTRENATWHHPGTILAQSWHQDYGTAGVLCQPRLAVP